ncbi:hypothetical protein HMPREF1531_01581 [Propionibacterium sp. oral taxon 192 str. F0372]|uniref:lactonase family protein n=1 Tax=Propionibacterium sp. oral taxon 192 TaxID=671222 RepID=UPI00035392A4|nr:beta-propeller fold lactonase family protein [Propionibacterium sp. oral taxon 192]EPH02275.1 hypothetical protein HMPREF1531_01581 [Propionibacterium sp. oral taxon 192 str. F0372]
MSRLLVGASDGTLTLLNLTADALTKVDSARLAAVGPLAIHPSGSVLFAASSPHRVGVVHIEQRDGSLVTGASIEVAGKPAHLSISPDGTWAVTASYHGGVAQLIRLDANGAPIQVTDAVYAPNLHSSVITADGCVHVVCLHDDVILGLRIIDGRLLPLGRDFHLPPGSGPRHIIPTHSGNLLVNTEFTGEVHCLHPRLDGTLEHIGMARILDDTDLGISRFGADPKTEHLIWVSDLQLDASEARLFCAERTNATISTLEVDGDGIPVRLLAVSPVLEQPRGFTLASDGRLVVASETSGMATVYTVMNDGTLVPGPSAEVGAGALWVSELTES